MKSQRSVSSPINAGFTRMTKKIAVTSIVASLLLAACGSPAPATSAPAASTTESSPPTATLNPEPSLTPTPSITDLEIVEWFEHFIPNLVDPSITDTKIEILVHNPNKFPVHVNTDELEFRLLNAAGEVVYTNSAPYFSLWEGSWMLAGESTGFQICACFQSQGLETQEWASIELVAPLEPADDVLYTTDVEAVLGEPFDIAEAHLGGSGIGLPTTLTNTSDQPLKSIPMRIIARDESGRYIGMPAFGNSVVSFTENISIQPGESLFGSNVSEIDYYDGPLTYEIAAIGLIAVATPTPGAPEGTPAADWQGIPIMPGAISGGEAADGYEFSTQATIEEITQFYEAALAELGYSLTTSGEQAGVTFLLFEKGSSQAIVGIFPAGELNWVQIQVTP